MKPFIPVVRAFILEDDRILVVKRAAGSRTNPGLWELPGGKLLDGETLDEALEREVYEETGLIVSPIRVLGAFQQEFPFKVSVNIIFHVKVEAGILSLSDEHEASKWVGMGEMGNLRVSPWLSAFQQFLDRGEDII
ncbi:DNA mismatch repair protein MutT [Methanothermobacter tenebrarum]|uniref:DNA mismatch repair protein MutT n=1 Tax=Methanothermobacter tenebrarum TaxID=680118 RepID=A0ABM7YBV1_9EURY|nr:NUDIX domain-containing protein [Methanothermobacter tenebrarum]MDI6882429.1 NUDIX domain-containing protein [Methanothermobacter sp.]BDH78733.1 DNA mismatch repair protein MutT [Methanothermobacter tenebrarum]